MNNLLTWLCLLAIVLFGVIVVAIEVHTNDSGQAKSRDPDAFLVAGSWIGIALIVGVAFVQKKAIRPTEVTANSITLAGVSDAFVAALKEKRKKMREIDDQTSPPMRDGPLLEVEEVEPLDEED